MFAMPGSSVPSPSPPPAQPARKRRKGEQSQPHRPCRLCFTPWHLCPRLQRCQTPPKTTTWRPKAPPSLRKQTWTRNGTAFVCITWESQATTVGQLGVPVAQGYGKRQCLRETPR